MLKFRKILSYQTKYLKQINNVCLFTVSEQQKHLKKLEQKSYLATKIIEKITQIRSVQAVQKNSLSKELIDLINNDNLVKDQMVKDEMLSFFTKGIKINEYIFDNVRHLAEKDLIDERNNLFTFFPTSLVTGQIFRKIMYEHSFAGIWVGHNGISASISIRLYWYLSNIINQYRFKSRQISAQLREQIEKYPKIIYINLDNNKVNKFDQVRKKIFYQCQQIGIDGLNELKLNQTSDTRVYKYYYRLNIKTILIFDQFEIYIKNVRALKQNKQKKLQLQILNLNNQFNQQIQDVSKNIYKNENIKFWLQRLFSKLRRQFCGIIYLSNSPIKTQDRQSAELCSDYRASLNPQRLYYLQGLDQDLNIYQLIDYFLFQMKIKVHSFEKISTSQFYQNNLQTIRSSLFNHMKQKSEQHAVSPYLIANYISGNINQLTLDLNNFEKIDSICDNQVSQKNIINDLAQTLNKKILDKIIYHSIISLTQKFTNLVNKLQQQAKYRLIGKLQQIKFQQKDPENRFSRYKIQLYFLHYNKFQPVLDGYFFYKQLYENNTYSVFSKNIVLKIIKQHKKRAPKYLNDPISEDLAKRNYQIKNNDTKEDYFKNLFIQAIGSCDVKVKFKLAYRDFQISQNIKYGFESIPHQNQQDYDKYSILQSFRQTYKHKDEQYNSNTSTDLFLPIYKRFASSQNIKKIVEGKFLINYKQHVQKSNQIFDMIISYHTRSICMGMFSLFAINITIASSKQVLDKMFNAILKLIKLNNISSNNTIQTKNGQQCEATLSFFILSPCKYDNSWKTYIKDKLKTQKIDIQFDQSDDDEINILKIKSINGNSNHFVFSVGFLYMGEEDMSLIDYQNQHKIYSLYDMLNKIVLDEINTKQKSQTTYNQSLTYEKKQRT